MLEPLEERLERAFLAARKPARIHLLGLGEKNRQVDAHLAAVRDNAPDAVVTLDSNKIAASVGRGGGKPRVLHQERAGDSGSSWLSAPVTSSPSSCNISSMERTRFQYSVRAVVALTRHEVDDLMRWARLHTDHWCRAAAKPGPSSFLWKLDQAIYAERALEIETELSKTELELLVKIAAPNDFTVHHKLLEILAELRAEIERLTA